MTSTNTSHTDELGLGAELKGAVTVARKLLDDLLEAEMATLGLTIGEADMLTVIVISSDHAPAPTELADWLSLTTAGVTGRLNTLETRRLIERRPHETDGRRLTVHLTSEGEQLATQVLALKDETLQTQIINEIGQRRAVELVNGLNELIAAANQSRAGSNSQHTAESQKPTDRNKQGD